MGDILITAPTEEPLTSFEAESHLRLEDGDGGAYLDSLIVAAREHVEEYTDRALVTQTWERVLDGFPSCGFIRLAKGRLQSAAATETTPSTLPIVTYYDTDGVLQTLAADQYQVDTVSEPGRIVLAPDCSWPDTESGRVNAVRVRYVAGYGAAAAVPKAIKQAMLLLISQMYEHREPEIVAPMISRFAFSAETLLSPYRLTWVS